MKVFVTGHKGYIGTHLVELLKEAGHWVTGCDLGLFNGCEWNALPIANQEIVGDFRTLRHEQLIGHDCVIHLAALSNDPIGRIDEQVTYAINQHGTVQLAKKAKQIGVPRFLFASSCAAYGKKGDSPLDESASFNPQSAYAISKVDAEKALSLLADATFCPVSLRNATAFGTSPMLRLDLVANNLLACAYATNEIRVTSDGSPWRPLVHCRDIARAFVAFLEAPTEVIYNRAVNIGGNEENYQVRDIAKMVQSLIPTANLIFSAEASSDPRSYRVNFDLLGKLLPGFQLAYTLRKGLEELHREFSARHFSAVEFASDRYFRLSTIKNKFSLLSI